MKLPGRRRGRVCFGMLVAAGYAALPFPQNFSLAQERTEYQEVLTLLRTGETVVGEPISYPVDAPAIIHSLIVTMKPGERTGRHKHGAPTYAYILAGQVTVAYDGGLTRTYTQGEAFMEAMDRWHDGLNDGAGPCRILVVFMGTARSRTVVRSD